MPTSRRTFLCGLGAMSAMAAARPARQAACFHYAGSESSIGVFRIGAEGRVKIQSMPSRRPSSLTLAARGRFLFAVNEIAEYEGLPAGSVESYAVEPRSGRLSLISRQSLSLSATMPRSLAVAPDGQYLVVAAYGGGAYNVFPVLPNGELAGVKQVIKEIGHGLHPERQTSAHPHSVVFHPTGKFLFSTDLGSDRISTFHFRDGRLARAQQVQTVPGTGPSELTMDATGSFVVVRHEFSALVSRYQFEAGTGRLRLVNQYNRLA